MVAFVCMWWNNGVLLEGEGWEVRAGCGGGSSKIALIGGEMGVSYTSSVAAKWLLLLVGCVAGFFFLCFIRHLPTMTLHTLEEPCLLLLLCCPCYYLFAAPVVSLTIVAGFTYEEL